VNSAPLWPSVAERITRRQYLLMKAAEQRMGVFVAIEAASSVALAHPEWDMDEERTWDEWEIADRPSK